MELRRQHKYRGIDGLPKEIKRGNVVPICKEQKYAVKAFTDLLLVKVQIGDMLVEKNIERYDCD